MSCFRWKKFTASEGAAGRLLHRLLHCGISAPSADGTIVIGFNSSHALNGALYSLRYDVLSDFEPISPLVTGPIVFYARKTMPAKDLHDLIDWLKANPDKASAGISTVGYHLVTGLNLRSYRIAASPRHCRTSLPAGSTCYLVRRTCCQWCGAGL